MLSRIALRSRGAIARLPTQRLVSQPLRQPVTITKPFVRFQHTSKPALAKLAPLDTFPRRHIGSEGAEVQDMLKQLGVKSIDEMLAKTIPSAIRSPKPLAIGEGVAERQLLARLKKVASKNKINRSYIGQGYTDTVVPNVILRNILENPAWYTQVLYNFYFYHGVECVRVFVHLCMLMRSIALTFFCLSHSTLLTNLKFLKVV